MTRNIIHLETCWIAVLHEFVVHIGSDNGIIWT